MNMACVKDIEYDKLIVLLFLKLELEKRGYSTLSPALQCYLRRTLFTLTGEDDPFEHESDTPRTTSSIHLSKFVRLVHTATTPITATGRGGGGVSRGGVVSHLPCRPIPIYEFTEFSIGLLFHIVGNSSHMDGLFRECKMACFVYYLRWACFAQTSLRVTEVIFHSLIFYHCRRSVNEP